MLWACDANQMARILSFKAGERTHTLSDYCGASREWVKLELDPTQASVYREHSFHVQIRDLTQTLLCLAVLCLGC